MLFAAADCAQGTGCHVITQLPWYFGVAVFVIWAAIVVGIVALLIRRARRRRRETLPSGYELEAAPTRDSQRSIDRM